MSDDWESKPPTKVCHIEGGSYCCGKTKPITEFGVRTRKRKNGNTHVSRCGRCKECAAKLERENKLSLKDKRIKGAIPKKVWDKFLTKRAGL